MRTSDIAWVPNLAMPKPIPPLNEMSLQEITKTYIRTCAKSEGKLSSCRDCKTKCKYGERALAMYEGKTILEDPVLPDETIIARMKAAKEKEMKPATRKKPKPAYSAEWFRAAMAQADPVKYTMETFNLSKRQAKSKIANFKYLHKEDAKKIMDELNPVKEEVKPVEEPKPVEETKPAHGKSPIAEAPESPKVMADLPADADMLRTLEQQVVTLTSRKQEYEQKVAEYQALLRKADDRIAALKLCMETFREDNQEAGD